MSGCTPNSISEQPTTLMVFDTNITWPLGSASANAPTNGASTTYEIVKKSFSIGVSHAGESSNASVAMAATSNALSASDEKNCAAMMMKKPNGMKGIRALLYEANFI